MMSDINVSITPPSTISATVGAAGNPIAVSVVEATPIVVTISNMPGATGPTGPAGPTGATGPAGSDATVTYSNVTSEMDGWTTMSYPNGAAVLGDTAFDVTYIDGATQIPYIYMVLNTSAITLRQMVI